MDSDEAAMLWRPPKQVEGSGLVLKSVLDMVESTPVAVRQATPLHILNVADVRPVLGILHRRLQCFFTDATVDDCIVVMANLRIASRLDIWGWLRLEL